MNTNDLDQLAERLTAHIVDRLDRAEVLDMLDLDAIALAAWTEHGPDWLTVEHDVLWRIAARQLVGPRSSTPCPTWCQMPPGHPYGDGDCDALVRYHQTSITPVGPLRVQIVQREDAVAPSGPIMLDTPHAEVWTEDDPISWSAEHLRTASAVLTDAADWLSRLRHPSTEPPDDTPGLV